MAPAAGEVYAAVEGARLAGAMEVAALDGQDGSRSLAVDDMHPMAKVIQGRPMPANYHLADVSMSPNPLGRGSFPNSPPRPKP